MPVVGMTSAIVTCPIRPVRQLCPRGFYVAVAQNGLTVFAPLSGIAA